MGRLKIYERLPFIYDVSTSDQNWQTALDHCAQVANSKGVALFAANKAGADFELSATNTFYAIHPKKLKRYLTTYRHYDEQGTSHINRCTPFQQWVPDKEIWPDLNVNEIRDDVRFLRHTFGINHRGGINISQDGSFVVPIRFGK